jgi:hypothetical protein
MLRRVSDILLVWTAASTDGFEFAQAHAVTNGALLVRCGLSELAKHALGSARPIVAVVDDEGAATVALGTGAHEVLCPSEIGGDQLDRASRRALARVATPSERSKVLSWSDGSAALSYLLESAAIELVTCVSGATLEAELLDDNIRRFMAEGGRPPFPASPLSVGDMLEMLGGIRTAFRSGEEVVQALRGLSGCEATVTRVGPILEALARVLFNRALPVATVEVQAHADCATTIPTSTIVVALVTLMAHALGGATCRGPGPKKPLVVLRAFVTDGTAIVEIESDAGAGGPDDDVGWDPVPVLRPRLRLQGADVERTNAPHTRAAHRLLLPLARADTS